MTQQRYAIVRAGIVENVTMWDGDPEKWQPPEGTTAVPCEAVVARGWAYDEGEFEDPSPPPPPGPVVPPSIANWKAHAILKLDGRHQDVLDVIAAIPDPVKRELVMTAFERLDPLPRHSATMVELLTVAGYDEAGIDDLFVRGNAIRIDAD